MSKKLIKNAEAIITCDAQDRLLRGWDILIDGNKIVKIAENISCEDAEVIDAKGKFVYPGLINTHHHLLQAFTRNVPCIQKAELCDWLLYLYNVWGKVNPEYIYYSSMVAMGEFVKYGGTTLFDHHFAFPRSSDKHIIDRQFDVADEMGVRFHSGRSCFTRGKDQGGLPPMELIETTDETLQDCERLIKKFHDPSEFSMRQVAVAPCSPFSVDTDDTDFNRLVHRDDFGRIGDVSVGHLRDMYQSVFFDTDVDETAELGNVGDYAIENHSFL